MTELKTFVITVSQQFPSTHERAGELTEFIAKIHSGEKIHTIRKNYTEWEEKINQVAAGVAILSIRVWLGEPDNSEQLEIKQISSYDLPGVQKITELQFDDINEVYCEGEGATSAAVPLSQVAINDGLSVDDFREWFKHHQREELAIIHFTSFRYLG